MRYINLRLTYLLTSIVQKFTPTYLDPHRDTADLIYDKTHTSVAFVV